MNPITAIIESLLDEHRDAGTHSNPELADVIANALISASWEQLAAITGGSMEHDHDGQVILHTGYFTPPVCRPFFAGGTETLKDIIARAAACQQSQLPEPKIIYGREPTEEDELRDELDARDALKALKLNF